MSNKSNDDKLRNGSVSDRVKLLANDTFVYGVTSTLTKLTTLITFPLLARTFSVEEYGIINYYNIIIAFLSLFIIFGLDSGVARFFVDCKTNDDKKQLISQAFIYQLGVIIIFFLTILLTIDNFPNIITDDIKNITYFKIAILQIPFLVLLNFTQNILKWTFEKYKFLFISIGYIFINLILLLIFILSPMASIEVVFIINAVSAGLASFCGIYFIRKWFMFPRSLKLVVSMATYIIPIGLVSTASGFFPYFERNLILGIFDSYSLGMYTAGFAIASLVNLIVQSFNTAWGPISLTIYKDPDAAKTYNVVLKAFTYIICIGVFSLSAIGEILMLVFAGEAYGQAAVLIFPISMSIAVRAIGWILEIGIGISKKTYLKLVADFIYLIIVYIAIILLAERLHIYGIALAILSAQIVKSLVSFYFAQHVYSLSWQSSKVFIFLIFNIVIGVLGYFVDSSMVDIFHIFSLVIISIVGWLYLFSCAEKDVILKYISVIVRKCKK